MKTSTKKILLRSAKAGYYGVSGAFLMLLKLIVTILLIFATTCFMFGTIFVYYIKNNLTINLDVDLNDFNLSQSSVLYCKDPSTGKDVELVKLRGDEVRTWVNYDKIPKQVEQAVVAIEDQRFYNHHGVDWYRTAGAFVNMFIGMRNTFGGSTITQQLIKNLTLENQVTVQRKLQEIFQALEFEKSYSKEEIIEWYLNAVYFGSNRWGIAAASSYYFGKDVSELTLAEIASIVGITNNPSLYSPYINPENNKARQETILGKMLEQGYISEAEYEEAVNQELVFKNGDIDPSKSGRYSYFEEAVINDVIAVLMEEKECNYQTAQTLLFSGGYHIYTTQNLEIQEIVDKYYTNTKYFTTKKGSVLQSGIVITDPYTGNILALSGGTGQKTEIRGLNRATQARRPSGSSIKPIASYAPAMDKGLITPNTLIEDTEEVVLEGTTWMPKNDSRTYSGIITIRTALRNSINTVAAQLVDMLSPETSYNFLIDKLGFTSLVPQDASYAPMALGQQTYGVTVREMAQAFSIFPNKGVFTEARTFTHICDSNGYVVYVNEPETHAAISEVTAYWMTSMLQDAVSNGTGSGAKISGMPTAGKTGTSGTSKDRWFVGFTPYYCAAIWVGYDTPAKISWSGNPAAQMFKKIMTEVHSGLEKKSFYKPAKTYQKPVPGVIAVEYTVRGIDEYGNVLYNNVAESVAGREKKVTYQKVEGYTLTSQQSVTIVIDEDSKKNVVIFTYKNKNPAPPVQESPPG